MDDEGMRRRTRGPEAAVLGWYPRRPETAQKAVPWVMGALGVVSLLPWLSGHEQGWPRAAGGVALVALAVVAAIALRRLGTELGEEGFRQHNGLTRGPLVRWDQVASVQVQGRFEAESRVVLRSGRSRRLLGVPRDVAQELARGVGGVP